MPYRLECIYTFIYVCIHTDVYFLQGVRAVRGNFSLADHDLHSQPFLFTAARTTDCTRPPKIIPKLILPGKKHFHNSK